MSEVRVCRTCGEEKPLTTVYFPISRRHWLRRECRPCYNASRRGYADIAYRWETAYRKIERRTAALHRDRTPIPDSDPWLDLQVIDACWRQCERAGRPALRRLAERLQAVALRLPRGFPLARVADDYAKGVGDLAMVRAQLDDLVSLARSA